MAAPRFLAVVDDDERFSAYLRTFLEVRGYATRCYTRGEQLLAAVRSGDAPSLVLLDLTMPGVDGLGTLRTYRELQPEGQAIVLSGQSRAATIVEALKLGAADYVVKAEETAPFDETELEAAIQRALTRRPPAPAPAAPPQRASDSDEPERAWWQGEGPMREVARMIDRVADSDVTVLVRGESGVGKELVTRALHRRSARARGPLVKVNCAALPAELLESELFGHERGAFTGADTLRIGKFEHAHGGTILLDEIGEMSARLQAKLLHVMQDGTFTRLGSNKPVSVDARVIAATNRDIEQMIATGEFREDLYYRLKVIEIVVPPLRERRDEILRLVAHFLDRFSTQYGRPRPTVPPTLEERLLSHTWPGNVRELENCLKRYVLLQSAYLIERELAAQRSASADANPAWSGTAAPLPAEPAHELAGMVASDGHSVETSIPDGGAIQEDLVEEDVEPLARTLPAIAREAVERAERVEIERALSASRWNRRRAAVQLGVSYKTLLNKIRELGIDAD